MIRLIRKVLARARYGVYASRYPLASRIATDAIHLRGAIQKRFEFAQALKRISSLAPNTVLEVGTRRGGSLYGWSQIAADHAWLISVDFHPSESSDTSESRLRSLVKSTQVLQCLWGNSHDTEIQRRIRQILNGRPVDLLFLDGDHTYDGIVADYTTFSPLVRTGGLIMFHDIVDNPQQPDYGVATFWRELRSREQSTLQFIDAVDPMEGFGIGVLVKS